MPSDTSKLAIREKIGYSLGDCAANFVFQTQIMFLMGFYTDVLGISALAAGNIFLFSRLWDAFNDPLMGAMADRTNTRWGKFRPWVLFTSVPFALLFVLAYTAPDFDYNGKLVWAIVTYNALMMIYTANNIPYSALTGVMTGDMGERASLVTWRFVLAMTAQFLVQSFTLALVARLGGGDQALGFQLTIGLWAAIAVLFFVVTFLTTRERVAPDPQQQTSILGDVADLFQNRNWIALAIATVFVFICLSMRGGGTYYYFQYYVGEQALLGRLLSWESLFGWFNGLGTAVTIIGVLLSKPLAMRFGKRDVFRTSLFLTAVCMSLFVFLPPSAIEVMFALQMLLQFIYGTTIPLLWAMMADVADFSEWKLGRRATAMTFAATVFALKLGLSIGGALAGWLLRYYGYQANMAQSEQALAGIRYMMSIFPALAFFAAAGVLLFYQIDKRIEPEMQDALADRRAQFKYLDPGETSI
jgi:glycoside/pentoside/hexuronide:cation symporter, GPH family